MKVTAKIYNQIDPSMTSEGNEPVALASVTLNDEVSVHYLRVFKDETGINLQMPCVVGYSGTLMEVCRTISEEAKAQITEAVEAALNNETYQNSEGDNTFNYSARAYAVSENSVSGNVWLDDKIVLESIRFSTRNGEDRLFTPGFRRNDGIWQPIISFSDSAQPKIAAALQTAGQSYGKLERFGVKNISELGDKSTLRFFKPLDVETGRKTLDNLRSQNIPYSAKVTHDYIQVAIRGSDAIGYSQALKTARNEISQRKEQQEQQQEENADDAIYEKYNEEGFEPPV